MPLPAPNAPHPLCPALRLRPGGWRFFPDRTSGTPVVALHGFAGSALDFEALAAALPAHLALIALDLPGHGHAAPIDEPEGWQATAIAARLQQHIKAEAPGARWLLGYSLGARLALELALLNPEAWTGLILIGAQPGLEDEPARAARRRADQEWINRLQAGPIEAFAEAWEAQPLIATQGRTPEPWGQRLRARRRLLHAPSVAACLRHLSPGSMPPLGPRLAALKPAVHLLHGAEDPKFAALAQIWAQRHPKTRVATVPDAGHAPHLEVPAACARLIDACFRPLNPE